MKRTKIRITPILLAAVLLLGSSLVLLLEQTPTPENELQDIDVTVRPRFQNEIGTRAPSDWPMHLGSISHLGFGSSPVPYDNTIDWSNTTGTGEGYGSPVISDGKVFVGSADGHIYCFDLNNGKRLWRTFLSNFDWGICSTPAVANNHVLVFSSGDDNLYRLRISDGGIDWTFDPPGSGYYGGSSPVVSNGRVYIGSGNRKLYCVNENTGSLIWTFTSGTGPLDYGIQSSPAVANGRVFIGSCDTYLYCINESQPSSTASYFWRTGLSDAIFGSPSVANGRVYCGSGYYNYLDGTDSHKMFCMDELTGSIIWSYQTGSDIISSPAIAYGNCYFSSTDGELYCVDATSSGPSPTLHWSETVGDTWSSPAVSDGRVVVGSRGTNTVFCFNATKGSLKWSFDAGDDIYSSPAIADGKVVIAVRGSPETILCFGGGTSPPPLPAPPTDLQAQLSGGGVNVMLTWDRSPDDGSGDDDVTGYTVYRSVTGENGVYDFAAWIPATGLPSYSWTDSGSGDGDSNNYFYIVRAKDDLNTEEENVYKVGKVVYDLLEGWNLISIPLEQSDLLREIVLQTIEGNYKAIQSYHAGSSKPWLHWHSDKPLELNYNDDIDHLRGYYIKMINTDSLVVVGKVRESTQISLKEGWNLIGYPYLQTQIRDAALSSILGSFDKVQYFDPATKTYGSLGPMDTMSPGMGYWIHATEDCIWSG